MPVRCEVCHEVATYTCSAEDQPMLNFCFEHYWEHVRAAHGGVELASPAYNG